MNQGPLDGIRVLDVATMLAGPYGATLLGDLGADVIKVESPIGDDSRHLGPEKNGERGPFISLNRNKRGMVIDLERPAGREVFARLAKTSDVIITNIRGPVLTRLGLSYEQLCDHRSDIIWVGVSAFGPDGPYAGRPGIDFLAQGYAGMLALNGEPGAWPVRVTIPVVDVMTSSLVATSVLAALLERGKSGKGQRIEISLLDALLHAMGTSMVNYLLTGYITPRTGNRSAYFSPSGVYECKDEKMIVLTCPSNKFFRNLCQALAVDWVKDPRFKTIDLRLQNEDALDQLIAQRCKAFTQAEVMERLIAADMLVAPVQGIPEVVTDPQVRHNQMIATAEHATLGPVQVSGVPIRMYRTPGGVRKAPPVHGQHTAEILAELGYRPDEIKRLVADKAVSTTAELQRRRPCQ